MPVDAWREAILQKGGDGRVRWGGLEAEKAVRIAYLDESGSSPKQRIVTVAGPIVHGDTQLIAVEEFLKAPAAP